MSSCTGNFSAFTNLKTQYTPVTFVHKRTNSRACCIRETRFISRNLSQPRRRLYHTTPSGFTQNYYHEEQGLLPTTVYLQYTRPIAQYAQLHKPIKSATFDQRPPPLGYLLAQRQISNTDNTSNATDTGLDKIKTPNLRLYTHAPDITTRGGMSIIIKDQHPW